MTLTYSSYTYRLCPPVSFRPLLDKNRRSSFIYLKLPLYQPVYLGGGFQEAARSPRNCQRTKRGRKRFFDKFFIVGFTIERAFAREDKFKRLLLGLETKEKRNLAFKLIAFTLINLREFCGG